MWNVFDLEENYLGTVHGSSESEALEKAKERFSVDVRVEERNMDDIQQGHSIH